MGLRTALRHFYTLSSIITLVHGMPAASWTKRQEQDNLDTFIEKQEPASISGVLANIGPSGALAYGANAGIIVASPSVADPDYFMTWTRDAALTIKALVDRFIATGDSELQLTIHDYISAQAALQTIKVPSGDLTDGAGLGEPKYYVDGTAFTGPWGRPQRDGPALRATAMIAYARWLLANNHQLQVTDIIWPIVRNDLEHVAQYWNETGYDLWEEYLGSSFFTTAVQHRALVEGSAFAASIGKSCENCDSQAPQLRCFLQTYWNGEHVVSNTNPKTDERSGKDAASILASIHTYDPDAGCDDITFQPCSPKALANHKQLTDSFRSIYDINKDIPEGSAVAVGRYAEDVYFKGNPWYLTTLAAAEQLYSALHQFNKVGSISITDTSLAFWKAIDSSAATGAYDSGSEEFKSLTAALKTYADGYVAIVQKRTPSLGQLAEQFDRNTGAPVSARDLTWSYASFLTMQAARNEQIPASWGASTVNNVPDQCSASPSTGSYTAVTKVEWPDFGCDEASSVQVTFNVLTPTVVGQEIFVSGSIDELGNWDGNKAIHLEPSGYRVDVEPLWRGSVTLDAGTEFMYKFFRKEQDGTLNWEGDQTVFRTYTVPKSCRTSAATKDEWKQ